MSLTLDGTTGISATGNIYGNNVIVINSLTAGSFSPASLSSSGNVTGGNILTGGFISATSTITSAANVVGNNITTGGLVTATGNVIGGNILTAGIMSSTGNAIHGNILTAGSMSAAGNITGLNINSSNADLAEMYAAGSQYQPGTVLVFGGSYEVEICQKDHANNIAGVVSTKPSYTMNIEQQGPHVVPVALQGRVPTLVVGKVAKGDRMASSPRPGVAQTLNMAKYEPGCIIGKALQDHEPLYDENGIEIVGVIEVVVGRL